MAKRKGPFFSPDVTADVEPVDVETSAEHPAPSVVDLAAIDVAMPAPVVSEPEIVPSMPAIATYEDGFSAAKLAALEVLKTYDDKLQQVQELKLGDLRTMSKTIAALSPLAR